MHDRERVADAVVELGDQQVALRLGLAAVGGVAEHDAHAVAERKQAVGHPASGEHDRLLFVADRFAALHRPDEQLAEPGVARAGKRLPQHAAEHLLPRTAEVQRGLVVEQDDAPVAIERVKALADPIENGVVGRLRCEARRPCRLSGTSRALAIGRAR